MPYQGEENNEDEESEEIDMSKTYYYCANALCPQLAEDNERFQQPVEGVCPRCGTALTETRRAAEAEVDDGLIVGEISTDALQEIASKKPRTGRDIKNAIPSQEAVNAKMGLSFVCSLCGKIHYPKSYVPKSCHESMPSVDGFGYKSDRHLEIFSTDMDPCVSRGTSNMVPDNQEEKYVVIADMYGFLTKLAVEHNRIRDEMLTRNMAIPMNSKRVVKVTKRGLNEYQQHVHATDEKNIQTMSIDGKVVDEDKFLDIYFPIHHILVSGTSQVLFLDVSEDGREAVFSAESHISPKVTMKKDKDATVPAADMGFIVEDENRFYLFHRHYYVRTTNDVTKECEVHQISTKVWSVGDARKDIKKGGDEVKRLR